MRTSLEGRRFDVLVIGGGITGAGVARDAAMRGLDVALVEKNDFASGTSSFAMASSSHVLGISAPAAPWTTESWWQKAA